LKNLYLPNRFFLIFGAISALFALGLGFLPLFALAKSLFFISIILIAVDGFFLFFKKPDLVATRKTPAIYSLADPNPVQILIENKSNLSFDLKITDELPIQFQRRDFEVRLPIAAKDVQKINFELTPTERGIFEFGQIHLFLTTPIGLLERRISFGEVEKVAVYPSIMQMKRFELRAFQRTANESGIKKMRRIGHSYEFEQIKNYVEGDDVRSVNWRASGRRGTLMVNQYEDERSQQVYLVIDKSRAMMMPFNGLSLLDYSVNAALALSNIVLKKGDKTGLITFSDLLGTTLKAERSPQQLRLILESLFDQKQRKGEADYDLLYHALRKMVPQRSLLLLFTNFESRYALDRALPILRRLARFHLLVVIFFENEEISDFAIGTAKTTEEIYERTAAQQSVSERREMVQRLRQLGIQAVLTRPQDLTIQTINKYAEIKARGQI
jgi:uncharacterized protein (DUF58 family)